MTKQDLQKELLEKVKPGTKPSHLKKLKRSKSADDIPTTPSSLPLAKSQSNPPIETKYPYTTLISQQQELERLQKESKAKSDTIALLRKKIESLEEPTNQEFKPTLTELDNSLFARHKNLKD